MQDNLAVLFSRQKIAEYEGKNSIQRFGDGKAYNLARFPSSAAHSIPQHYRQTGSQPLQSDTSGDSERVADEREARVHQSQAMRRWEEFPQGASQTAVESPGVKLSPTLGRADYGNKSLELRDDFLDSHQDQCDPRPVAGDLDMSDADHYENIECDTSEAEPYIVSGYAATLYRDDGISASTFAEKKSSGTLCPGSRLPDEPTTGLPYRLSNDPIYNGRRWWENGGSEPIEHQYGVFEQMNLFGGCGVVTPH
ncbi:hypothetical protein T310_4293 [Rasamsonia emersonii CBS 393.64]|uniref:Uncharacterized protein n=1 Tax=Rasamsonia emersonii (strain ATCC 16479 / CBS 393.64 / IMI 116815) TaxID=1408163 RepID=A0A0F4YV29_RASE3|nr:hypothetical protein T310_4293 [Rasamsonia emersonii CBS 393.64]KKA21686.1 hypothetical protein T310_4293 [Rasamsonia emersonii CBS 393.64]